MEPSEPEHRAESRPQDRERAATGRVRRLARRAPELLRTLLAGLVRWALRLGLPLAGAAALLHSFPYRATVQGIEVTVEGSLLTRPGLTADTTFGSWIFPQVSGLPVGVHLTPVNVDVLQLTRAAGADRSAFAERLQADVVELVPRITTWLLGEVLLGILLGLLAAAAINMSVRYLRRRAPRPDELRHRLRQLGAAGVVVAAVATYGWVTYNPDWAGQSRLTGTLAAAQLFPTQLRDYYTQQSKVFDVLGSVIGLQAALQNQIDDERTPPTAVQIMFISDMHLAANYPLVQQYADSYDVDLIVNTGDDSAFGTRIELTSAYLDSLRALTARVPMLWVAGNHDSPATVDEMRSIPGVTVLGTKTATTDGYRVTAGVVEAYGLTIAGLSDPRVYGGPGAYGADDPAVTEPLERAAVEEAVAGLAGDETGDGDETGNGDATEAGGDGSASEAGETPRVFDIFATHEVVAADELRAQLGDRIRQTNAGHTHRQNDPADIQRGSAIDLVEGSTGAGGLDNIVRGTDRPAVAFSIESVAADCQFTRVIRFQIHSPGPAGSLEDTSSPQAYGNNVTTSTVYFTPQDLAGDRSCGRDQGIGQEAPL